MPRKKDGMPFEVHPTPAKGKDGKNIVYVRPAMRDKLTMQGLEDFCSRNYGLRFGELGRAFDVFLRAAGEEEIQRHNRPYQQASSIEEVLTNLFVPATDHQRENLWQVQDIQKELSKHLKISDVQNLVALGKILKTLRWPRGGNTGTRGYYLQLKES